MIAHAVRTAALLTTTAAVLAGCAQPGQLGHPAVEPTVVPAPAPAVIPAPHAEPRPTGPVLVGSGKLDERVSIRTTGPSQYSVRTIVLEPGEDTGWHAHPGTELAIVTAGRVELLADDACDPVVYTAGSTLVVPDEQVHLVRNDGGQPAELVITRLLAPGEPEQATRTAAC